MKNILLLIIIGAFNIGLFSFFIKAEKKNPEPYAAIKGVILLEENNSFKIEEVISELENKWNLKIESKDIKETTSVFKINGYNVITASIPFPIPEDEIKNAAEQNYFWEKGAQEATKHKGHIILSLMGTGKNPLKENILFNQIASSILEKSNSSGIYLGARTLLLKKDFYLANTSMMTEEDFPLYNWIYFGLRQENAKQSIYTYGLSDFGKKEMEIVNSKASFDELNELMFNMAHYVIAYDVTLKAGETIGVSAEQKLKIIESKGKFVEGTTLKIEYKK